MKDNLSSINHTFQIKNHSTYLHPIHIYILKHHPLGYLYYIDKLWGRPQQLRKPKRGKLMKQESSGSLFWEDW